MTECDNTEMLSTMELNELNEFMLHFSLDAAYLFNNMHELLINIRQWGTVYLHYWYSYIAGLSKTNFVYQIT